MCVLWEEQTGWWGWFIELCEMREGQVLLGQVLANRLKSAQIRLGVNKIEGLSSLTG